MKSITFNCETITPMFLGGAKDDGRCAELRPPSIKGLMRFWWRAVRGLSDIKQLQKEESEIFGSSEEKYGKSKFSLKINVSNDMDNFKYKPMPHHTGDINCQYLTSCKGRNNNRCSKGFKLPAINVGKNFDIIISTKFDNKIACYTNILEISLLLGGLGKRSRRGFGSVYCSNWNFNDNESVMNFILNKLNSINNNSFRIDGGKILRNSNPQSQYPFIKEIRLGKNENDYNRLLLKIGQATHANKDSSLGYAGKWPPNSNNTIRMSSPVYVSCTKINNKYVPIITILNPAFPRQYPQVNDQKRNNFIGAL